MATAMRQGRTRLSLASCVVTVLGAMCSLAPAASAQDPIACFKQGELADPADGALAPDPVTRAFAPSAGMVLGRWATTATDGSTGPKGDPVTITWGIVPDGTPINGFYTAQGEGNAPSNLIATLDGIYGSSAVWRPLVQEAFDAWSGISGLEFVEELADDQQTIPTFGSTGAGTLGVRPDVRIGGHAIDGNYAIVAYARQPSSGGDIVIDTDDTFYGDLSGRSVNFRNTLTHELGHAMGLEHVCPTNATKLMEPSIVQNFDGPQHDDLLAMNENYGDVEESDDSTASARVLGFGAGGSLIQQDLSIDGPGDEDWIAVSEELGLGVTVGVQAYGDAYLYADSVGGSCSGTSPVGIDTTAHQDLAIQLVAPNGVTELAWIDGTGAGGNESVTEFAMSSGGYIRVVGDGGSDPQVYDLTVELVPEPGALPSAAAGLLALAFLARRRVAS